MNVTFPIHIDILDMIQNFYYVGLHFTQ